MQITQGQIDFPEAESGFRRLPEKLEGANRIMRHLAPLPVPDPQRIDRTGIVQVDRPFHPADRLGGRNLRTDPLRMGQGEPVAPERTLQFRRLPVIFKCLCRIGLYAFALLVTDSEPGRRARILLLRRLAVPEERLNRIGFHAVVAVTENIRHIQLPVDITMLRRLPVPVQRFRNILIGPVAVIVALTDHILSRRVPLRRRFPEPTQRLIIIFRAGVFSI